MARSSRTADRSDERAELPVRASARAALLPPTRRREWPSPLLHRESRRVRVVHPAAWRRSAGLWPAQLQGPMGTGERHAIRASDSGVHLRGLDIALQIRGIVSVAGRAEI